MSNDYIGDEFEYEGSAKETHAKGGRGIFGLGVTEVIFKYAGTIKTIKDGHYCQVKPTYKKVEGKEREFLEIDPSPPSKEKVNDNIQKEFRIPFQNGTNVEFDISKNRFPQINNLLTKLSNHYMLRFINSKKDRKDRPVKLILIADGKKKKIEEPEYHFPDEKPLGELITEFRYKKYPPIQLTLAIFKNEKPLSQGETPLDERDGGILCFDEECAVYDLTLFDYDKMPFANKFYGLLQLKGARKILKEEIDKHNQNILTEEREGFNKRHEFYIGLNTIISKFLEKFVQEEKALQADKEMNLSASTRARHRSALQRLNELYEKINEKTELLGPSKNIKDRKPQNGLEFTIEKAHIKIGKRYLIHLRVDTETIEPGSKIEIKSDNKHISIKPKEFTVEKANDKLQVFSKMVELQGDKIDEQGFVKANHKGIETQIDCYVTKEDFPQPVDGIEFFPKSYISEPKEKRHLYLYIDQLKIQKYSKIKFESDNPEILVDFVDHDFLEKGKKIKNIYQLSIGFEGKRLNQRGTVIAKCKDYVAATDIKIQKREKRKKGGGIFKDWKYRALGIEKLTWFDEEDGFILINSDNKMNRKFFGPNQDIMGKMVQNSPLSQIYLGELILDEGISYILGKAAQDGKLKAHDTYAGIRGEVHKLKNKTGISILEEFVTDRKYWRELDKLKKPVEE